MAEVFAPGGLGAGVNGAKAGGMNNKLAALLAMLAALAALGFAYFVQFDLHRTPCALCLVERWPYRAVAVLGLLGVLSRPRGTRLLLGLAGLVMLGDAGVAFLHVGVEFGWWKSPLPECNGVLVPGQPLPLVPATPCDKPVYLAPWLHVSMAMMDLGAALVFAALLLGYALRKRRVFR